MGSIKPLQKAEKMVVESNSDVYGIRDVWASNLTTEFKEIRQIVQRFPFVAMDTEFPGVVARPIGEFKSTADYQYQLLRCNVGLLKVIQVGLTFMNDQGELAPKCSTWQFHFRFNLGDDMYAQDSIDLLQNSGINFKKHEEEGIDVNDFAELLIVSGLVLCDNVKWISFHSGYDFGYLLKLLSNQPLPVDEVEFFDLLQIYFPVIYDIKYLMKSCKQLKGGLQEVADQLQIQRLGPQHQAGSDSLLTGNTFFKIRQVFFDDNLDDAKFSGHLYGLGPGNAQNGVPAYSDDINVGKAVVNVNVSGSNAQPLTADDQLETSSAPLPASKGSSQNEDVLETTQDSFEAENRANDGGSSSTESYFSNGSHGSSVSPPFGHSNEP